MHVTTVDCAPQIMAGALCRANAARSRRGWAHAGLAREQGAAAKLQVDDFVEVPFARDAFQFGGAAVGELDAGAGDEVLHRARDDRLAWAGVCRDAGADMNGDAPQRFGHAFALAGVNARPDLETELGHGRRGRAGAADRSRGAVEGSEEA